MTDGPFLLLTVVGAVLGYLGHELAHWSVAQAFGRSAWIDWSEVETVWCTNRIDWRDCVAGLAPQTLGVTFGGAAIAGLISPPAWIWPGWILFSLTGSREDYAIIGMYIDERLPCSGS